VSSFARQAAVLAKYREGLIPDLRRLPQVGPATHEWNAAADPVFIGLGTGGPDRRAWAGMTHGCTMIIKGRRYTSGAAGIARSNSVELLERDFDRDLQQL
jgi:hypothetical protein